MRPDTLNGKGKSHPKQEKMIFKNSSVKESEGFKCGLAQGAKHVISLNSYPNGVSVSIHSANDFNQNKNSSAELKQESDRPRHHMDFDPFFLRTRDTREIALPDGKFLIYRENYKTELESLFLNLSKKGTLDSAAVYFGVNNDPFHAFHKKFAQTAACLDILERFKPARLIIQSRSRMLLTALPTIKVLGDRVYCVVPFESCYEKVIARYTPGQPRLEERLITAAGLQAQGVKLTFCVSPVLPYGETSGDTWRFAELLVKYSDRVLTQSLCTGTKDSEAVVRKMSLSQKLEADRQEIFLRPNADQQLRQTIEKISKEHLVIEPIISDVRTGQLSLFAA